MAIRTERVVPHQSRWTAGADFFERSKSTGLLRDSAAPTRWLGGDDAAGASSFRRSSQGDIRISSVRDKLIRVPMRKSRANGPAEKQQPRNPRETIK
jgi:hypothetical protein